MKPHLIVAVLFGTFLSTDAVGQTTTVSCGSAQFSVFNSAIAESPFFVLRVATPTGWPRYYPLYMGLDFLKVRCEAIAGGAEAILFEHSCSGSGCDSNYGVIDVETGRLLSEPGDGRSGGNQEATARILGHPVRAFECNGGLSSTSQTEGGTNGEYCYVSPQEQG